MRAISSVRVDSIYSASSIACGFWPSACPDAAQRAYVALAPVLGDTVTAAVATVDARAGG
ncbi:MAG: hypothetical protein M3R63_01825 [Actinomycetota bacterium]|nr:hypothetical protein [Actinomycetota bacterium]